MATVTDCDTHATAYYWGAGSSVSPTDVEGIDGRPASPSGVGQYGTIASIAVTMATSWAAATYPLTPTMTGLLASEREATLVELSQDAGLESVIDEEVIESWRGIHSHLIDVIRSWSAYTDDWDGHGGLPPTDGAVSDAVAFVGAMPEEWPSPRAGLSGDGEIGLFWDFAEGFVDIGFTGDGHYSFYARTAYGSEVLGDDYRVGTKIPDELAQVVQSYS